MKNMILIMEEFEKMKKREYKKILSIGIIGLFFGVIFTPVSISPFENAIWKRLTKDNLRDFVKNGCIATTPNGVFITYGKSHGEFGFNIHYLYLSNDLKWSEDKIVESRFPCYRPTIAAQALSNDSVKIAVAFDNEDDILCSVIYDPDDKWGQPVNISYSTEQDWNPTIVMDENGVIHCAWIAKFIDSGKYKIVYAREDSDSWSIEIINESELGGYGWGANPDIVLVDGLPHIFYRGGDYGSYQIHHAYKESMEGLWLTEFLTTGNNEDLSVSAKVDSIGDIHLAVHGYDGWDPECPRRIFYLRRDYSSEEWEETIFISEDAGTCRVGISDDDTVFIVYLGQWWTGLTGDMFLATKEENGFAIVELSAYPIAVELYNPSVDYWPGKGGVLIIQATIGDYDPIYNEIVFYGPIGSNVPPVTPNINGPRIGKIDVDSKYCISDTIDPDGDDVYCLFDWGDGSDSGWLGPYSSGEEICVKHNWSRWGIYKIKAKLSDENGAESDWGTISVIMPKSKFSYTDLLLRLFKKIEFACQSLAYLIKIMNGMEV
jgi:hypothetical protein